MNRRALLSVAAASPLAMCSAVQAGLSTTPAVATAASATAFWGIVKGIANVALSALEVLDPPVGVALNAAVSSAQALVDNLTGDATAISAAYDAAHGVLTQAAPYITAIPNGQA